MEHTDYHMLVFDDLDGYPYNKRFNDILEITNTSRKEGCRLLFLTNNANIDKQEDNLTKYCLLLGISKEMFRNFYVCIGK